MAAESWTYITTKKTCDKCGPLDGEVLRTGRPTGHVGRVTTGSHLRCPGHGTESVEITEMRETTEDNG
jgi:hypothetical protein